MSTPRSLAIPDGVRSGRARTERGEFAILEAGGGGPLALLLPGWTGSKEDFIAVLRPLADAGFHAVAYDQRGQYETPGSGREDGYTLAELGEDGAALVAALSSPGQHVHLVGHSFGGLVARAAVVRHEALVTSLTLLCSGPGAIPSDRQQLLRAMADAIPSVGLAATWQAKRAYERSQGAPEVPADVERFLQRRFLANDPVSLRSMTEHLISAPDDVDVLAGTGVPVLVAFGATDDGWPLDAQREMARRLGAQLTVLDQAGHSPAVESPQALVAALTVFWAATAASDQRAS